MITDKERQLVDPSFQEKWEEGWLFEPSFREEWIELFYSRLLSTKNIQKWIEYFHKLEYFCHDPSSAKFFSFLKSKKYFTERLRSLDPISQAEDYGVFIGFVYTHYPDDFKIYFEQLSSEDKKRCSPMIFKYCLKKMCHDKEKDYLTFLLDNVDKEKIDSVISRSGHKYSTSTPAELAIEYDFIWILAKLKDKGVDISREHLLYFAAPQKNWKAVQWILENLGFCGDSSSIYVERLIPYLKDAPIEVVRQFYKTSEFREYLNSLEREKMDDAESSGKIDNILTILTRNNDKAGMARLIFKITPPGRRTYIGNHAYTAALSNEVSIETFSFLLESCPYPREYSTKYYPANFFNALGTSIEKATIIFNMQPKYTAFRHYANNYPFADEVNTWSKASIRLYSRYLLDGLIDYREYLEPKTWSYTIINFFVTEPDRNQIVKLKKLRTLLIANNEAALDRFIGSNPAHDEHVQMIYNHIRDSKPQPHQPRDNIGFWVRSSQEKDKPQITARGGVVSGFSSD